jgi:hypothetical protein
MLRLEHFVERRDLVVQVIGGSLERRWVGGSPLAGVLEKLPGESGASPGISNWSRSFARCKLRVACSTAWPKVETLICNLIAGRRTASGLRPP